MGRWAEVYFTTPPESREQAVMELLHDLKADKARRESALASELAAQPPLSRCENCGYDNPGVNRFCGMCGASTSADADRQQVEHRPPPPPNGNGQGSAHEPEPQPWSEPAQSSDEDTYAAPRHELSLFQAYRETDADDGNDWNYEPAPSSSSRWYIGAVLFLLIVGLGYMAWRGMQNSQTSHGVSAPPPVTAQQAPPEVPGAVPREDQPAATKSEAPDIAANKPRESTAATAAPKEAAKANADQPAKEAPTPPPAPATAKAAATESSDQVSQPNPPADRFGAEELAVAQRYLNGANGQRRDTTEAAKWLWKSIAKHNGQATVLLADLYLKGDGVSKNCDQARILLDSAARKGITGAGERLRNLPAFGCQ